MGWFDWLKLGKTSASAAPLTEERASTLANPEQWFLDWAMGGNKSAGKHVNEKTALSVSAVYACCSIRAKSLATLKLGYYERGKNGELVEITDAPEAQAICERPCELYTGLHWRQTSQLRVDLHGNAYSELEFNSRGDVTGARLLTGHVVPYEHKGKLFYKVTDNDGQRVLPSGMVLHVKGLSLDGIVGISPLQMAKHTIGRALASEGYMNDLYEKSGVLRGFIESPALLKDAQVKALREALMEVMRDFDGTGGIGVLQGGNTFKPVSLSPRDVQFIQQANLTVADVSRFYAVPLHMISELTRSTNNNIEQQSSEFVRDCARPNAKYWEDALDTTVVAPAQRGKRFFRFNLESLLRGDSEARSKFYKELWWMSAINADTIRALENMPPLPDGLGQKYYAPLNARPIDEPLTQQPTT